MPAAKEKTYKCLNPVGIREPVDIVPLAPRLDKNKLDGNYFIRDYVWIKGYVGQ